MKLLRAIVLILPFFWVPSSRAFEAGILGGVNSFGPDLKAGPASPGFTFTAVPRTASGFGAFVKFPLVSVFDLELDFIRADKKIVQTASSSSFSNVTTIEMSSWMVPLLLRVNVVPGGFLSLAAGGYYEWASGREYKVNGVSTDYAGSGFNHRDIGVLGSLRLRFPVFFGAHAILDGRYLMGLQEQATDTTQFTMKSRHLQAFFGVSFGS